MAVLLVALHFFFVLKGGLNYFFLFGPERRCGWKCREKTKEFSFFLLVFLFSIDATFSLAMFSMFPADFKKKPGRNGRFYKRFSSSSRQQQTPGKILFFLFFHFLRLERLISALILYRSSHGCVITWPFYPIHQNTLDGENCATMRALHWQPSWNGEPQNNKTPEKKN